MPRTSQAKMAAMEQRIRFNRLGPTVCNPCPWKGGKPPAGIKTERLIVCGSRDFDDYELMKRKLDTYTFWFENVEVYSGGQVTKRERGGEWEYVGADHLAEKWATANYYTLKIFHADWDTHGKKAGPLRNAEMVAAAGESAYLVAFLAPNSVGTLDTLKRAARCLKPNRIKVVKWKP